MPKGKELIMMMVMMMIQKLGLSIILLLYLSLQGKLGHGDTNRVYKPKVIEGLQGLVIKKVCCGSQFSLALTSSGLVSFLKHFKTR